MNEFNGLLRVGSNPELRQRYDETNMRPAVGDKRSIATATEQIKLRVHKINFLQITGHQKI